MNQTTLRKSAIAASTVAITALFSFSWSEQSGVSLSVDNAQAQSPGSAFLPSAGQTPGVGYGRRRHAGRLYVSPHYYYYPYVANQSGLEWYAVRAYYTNGPWSGFHAAPFSWAGWDDYASRNGIGCTPGSLIKGGDGIVYVCQ